MKSAIVPIFCGLILTAISAAGISHWWSVHEMIELSGKIPASVSAPIPPPSQAAPEAAVEKIAVAPLSAAPSASQEEFYRKMAQLLGQNKAELHDLRDQMAETNRDVMNLNFRLDTHSRDFMPLKIEEKTEDTTLDQSHGVLPTLEDSIPLPKH